MNKEEAIKEFEKNYDCEWNFNDFREYEIFVVNYEWTCFPSFSLNKKTLGFESGYGDKRVEIPLDFLNDMLEIIDKYYLKGEE